MQAELISTRPASSLKSKKAFFGAKKNVDISQEQATKPAVSSKIDKKRKRGKDKKAIAVLQRPVREIKAASKKYKKHKEPQQVADEKFESALLPPEKANQSVANRDQVEEMAAHDKKDFETSSFKKKIRDKIYATIQDKNDAKNVSSKKETVAKEINESLQQKKDEAGGKIEQSVIVPPQTPQIKNPKEKTSNKPISLIKDKPAGKTLTRQRSALAPTQKTSNETDFSAETRVLDEEYKQNNLSGEKLQNSNEPTFIQADQQKSDSQKKARELTTQYRADENKTISGTKRGNAKAINRVYNSMLMQNATVNGGVFALQRTKSIEEKQIRKDISIGLEIIFNETNKKVLKYFSTIDFYIKWGFNAQISQYLDKFSKRVARLLDENTGWFDTGVKYFKGDKVLNEVEIFDIAKNEFIDDMQSPINSLVKIVDIYLLLATQETKKGKVKVAEFWKKQPEKDKRIAGDIFEESDRKFDELEKLIENKEEAVINTVTEKFKGSLDELDQRFEKAKEENKSWLDRAIGAVKAVINTIIELKNAIKAVAKKAEKYAGQIIDDPITFFGNLSEGVGQGFTNFKNNIDKHLIKGVLEWLTGSMAGSEIELPKELNFEGITSLVMQILGISIKKIKKLVIGIIGKEHFEFIEKGVDAGIAAGNKILNLFKILNEKGLSGLWEFIKEEFGNLKEMLIENVKTFVIETIARKAMEFLLSLLIPGAGFVRAAQLLIRFVVTLFQKAAQIIKIIDGIIESFGDILKKDLAGAAKKVESVLSGFISLAISFLAAVLGLGGIVRKVQKFIQQKIRPKIDKILNKIALKIKQLITKLGLTKLIDKSMKAVDKGKAWAEDKKKKVVETGKKYGDKLLVFLGLKKRFKLGSESHTLLFENKNGSPVFFVNSTPQKYSSFIKKVSFEDKYVLTKNISKKYNGKTPQETATNAGNVVDKELGKYKKTDEKDIKKWADDLVKHMNNIAKVISKYAQIGSLEVDVPSIVEWKSTNAKGMGKKVIAKQLTSNYIVGQETGEEQDSGGLTKEWDIISQNIGNKSRYYYVRGHLLNAKVGGVVNNTNLTPLSGKSNREHLKNVEKAAKKIVTGQKSKSDSIGKKGIIYYSVESIYGNHTKRNLTGLTDQEKLVKATEETKGVIPTRIKYTLKKMKIANGKVVVDDSLAVINGSIENELPPVVKLKK